MTTSDTDAYHELCCYTLARGDAGFIHQHVVDAFAAQHADERSKPIGVVFALVGIHLVTERGFSGRQVQRAHMRLAREKSGLPTVVLPAERGAMTALDVMAVPEGEGRDQAIRAWCASVWAAFAASRQSIVDFLRLRGIVP